MGTKSSKRIDFLHNLFVSSDRINLTQKQFLHSRAEKIPSQHLHILTPGFPIKLHPLME